MAFEGYERFEFAREGRILTATISAPGPVNAVDAALHAVDQDFGGMPSYLAHQLNVGQAERRRLESLYLV